VREATTKPHVDELMLNMEMSVSEVIFPQTKTAKAKLRYLG
jgi:hypothetical protein